MPEHSFASSVVERRVSTSLDTNGNRLAFWAYILQCADGRYYTGHTDNLEARIAQHQSGGYCRYTSTRRPVRLLWSAEFPTRIEALEAEQKIKKWSQAKKQALIQANWRLLSHFAIPPKERSQRDPIVSSEVETQSTVT